MSTSPKILKKGFKFPIYPTSEQRALINQTFGCCRYVWNKALGAAVHDYKQYLEMSKVIHQSRLIKPDVSGYGFVNRLPAMRRDPETPWLSDVSSVALQQTMLHLGGAFTRFFKEHKGYPKFKKKHGKQSFSLMKTAFTLGQSSFFIAKCKTPIKVVFSRLLPSEPSSLTISRTSTGKYYVSFVCEYQPVKTSGHGRIGIDLGIKDFATLSTGKKITNPKPYLNAQRKLKRAQQALSRKQKGSNNRHKARLKVAHLHERVANTRNDFQHKLSRQLINDNQVIAVEKLIVANMVKNRKLAKHISDASWASFTNMLNYKAIESQHSTIFYVSTWFPSSHLCSVTHERLNRKLTLSERAWDCPYCGQRHDRDVNAATNILHEAEFNISLKFRDPSEIAGKIVLANSFH